MSGFLNALWIVPILGVLIFLHELGHFVMARRAGVRVEEFGFGLPPRIWGVKRGDTLYSINALPIGGFVRVLGEDGKSNAADSMQSKTMGQRAKFLAAGSIVNFLTAFLLIGVLVAADEHPPADLTQNVYVHEVVSGSPAEAAGWQQGDRFIAIDGEPVTTTSMLSSTTERHAGSEMSVVIERDGQQYQTTITPRVDPPAGEGRNGIIIIPSWNAPLVIDEVPQGSNVANAGFQPGDVIQSIGGTPIPDALAYSYVLDRHAGETLPMTVLRAGDEVTADVVIPRVMPAEGDPLGGSLSQDIDFQRTPISEIPVQTVKRFGETIQGMFTGLRDLVTGRTPLDEVAGPIGMGQLTSEVIQDSGEPLWITLVGLTTLLSLNLGLLNLLPLPALDGGRLLFVLIEFLRRGKRVPPEKEGLVHLVGLAILLTLMLAIAVQDVDRLISGGGFLE